MRILLDTNILVRAAADEQGLAGRLLLEIASGPHVLVSSPYVLSEVARVLAYARLQVRWQLDQKTIREFVSRVSDIAGRLGRGNQAAFRRFCVFCGHFRLSFAAR